MKTELRQQVVNHVAMHVGQTAVDAVVTNGEFAMVDAQQMKDRGVDIVDLRRVVSVQRFVAPLI